AAKDILEQLNVEENKLKNTIFIAHFYYECVESGLCEALRNTLPFPVVGCVATYVTTNIAHGDCACSVTMITSDDTEFFIRSIKDVHAKTKDDICEELTKICEDLNDVKMCLSYLTPTSSFNGDDLAEIANDMENIVPFYGVMAYSLEGIDGANFVMDIDEISCDMFLFVAFCGKAEFSFRVATSFAFEEKFTQEADVTEADGAVLKTINGQPVVQYLKDLGMIKDGGSVTGHSLWTVPAVISYPNGTVIARSFFGIIDDTEFLLATGAIKTGGKIRFAHLDGNKTIASAAAMVDSLTEENENNVLMYNCGARVWSVGKDVFAESEKIAERAKIFKEKHNETLLYSIASCGGEICPITDKDDKLVNALHNYSFITCSFK
ncbi:MAG: FIST C-terminal domain-containing protein, partial [Defluviitaleaceae bacterium]|nr:FIST C-terminal domain-containing protein [Defluviitaleaceae bacterium]